MSKRQQSAELTAYPWRFKLAMLLMCATFLAIAARAVDLQIFNHQFLNDQGNARSLRTETVNAHRGMILDRAGRPLAVSTPMMSIWANPREVGDANQVAAKLAAPLAMDVAALTDKLAARGNKEFLYLKRKLPPAEAERILALRLPGIYAEKEYRRYYPAAEVTAHLLGFTDIDDLGQEGIELAYNNWLAGVPGKKQVVKDRFGRWIKDVRSVQQEKPGRDLELSIDLRIQYLAYRELKAAVAEHKAKAGMMVLLDAHTGEVLALVNQPSYNPNNRSTMNYTNLRNRAFTDVFEPGSTMKPFTIAAALESGKFTTESKINTAPGYLRIGPYTVRDARNYGSIDLAGIIAHSSNIGAARIALALDNDAIRGLLSRAGIGRDTGTGFPGERVGMLPYYEQWREVDLAALSRGYGLAVTGLQLAQAYTAFANAGRVQQISLVKRAEPPAGQPIMLQSTAQSVLEMLERVVAGGTGSRAGIAGYRVAGKTGTVHKILEGAYQDDKYMALFAGVAPVSNPRIVGVVVIDEPQGDNYGGGLAAAPVFSRVVAGALRILDVSPDRLNTELVKSNAAGAKKGNGV